MKSLLNLVMILCLVGCEYETAPEDLVPGSAGPAEMSCEDSLTWTDSDGNPCSAFAALQEYCPGIAGAEANCPVSCGICEPVQMVCADSSTWTDTDGNPCSAFAALQEYCPEIAGAQDNCPVSCGLCVPEVADSTPEPELEL